MRHCLPFVYTAVKAQSDGRYAVDHADDNQTERLRTALAQCNFRAQRFSDGGDAVSRGIEEISRTEENCVNVMTRLGIGPMISTATPTV